MRIINRDINAWGSTAAAAAEPQIKESALETVFANSGIAEETTEMQGIDCQDELAEAEEVEEAEDIEVTEETTEMQELVWMDSLEIETEEDDLVEKIVDSKEAEAMEEAVKTFTYSEEEVTSVDGKYRLEMVETFSPETMITSGIQLFLRDKSTGDLKIGCDGCLKLDKDKIQNADNHSVMYILKKFDVEFSDDSIQLAWAKARELLNSGKMAKAITSSSLTILEAFEEVVAEVYRRTLNPDYNIMKTGKPVYIVKQDLVWIETTKMAEVLEVVGSGYKPATFCKRLAVAGAANGFKYIEKTSHGYATNTNGNVRYYILKIPKEIQDKIQITEVNENA